MATKVKKKASHHPKASLPARAKKSGKSTLVGRPVDEDPTATPSEAAPAQDGENLEIPTNAKPKRGRQARLPEMEDPEIEELESLAESYAEVRDERMELSIREGKLKSDLLSTMKELKRETYNHGGVTIKIVLLKETVKVRINKMEHEANSEE